MRSAVLEDGTFGAGPRAGAQPSEETGTDGTFTLEHLRAGTYTVRAAAFGGSAVFGAPPLGGIRLPEGGAVDGLELRLGPACTLRGVVRDPDGAPVGGAAVFVRDASGRLVESVSSVVTDVAGRFSCAGIPAGDASVAARDGARASAEVHAHADASSPADVELARQILATSESIPDAELDREAVEDITTEVAEPRK